MARRDLPLIWSVLALGLLVASVSGFVYLRDRTTSTESLRAEAASNDVDGAKVVDGSDLNVEIEEGPVIDLEHPTAEDLAFLQDTLRAGDDAARRSATKALLLTGDRAGIPMLFEASGRHSASEDAALYCLVALEIARLQPRAEVLVVLLRALDQTPPMPADCRTEVEDRFRLIGGRSPDVIADLEDHPDPMVRGHVARALADEPGTEVAEILLRLAADPEVRVRRRAWLALSGREIGAEGTRLATLADAEKDPELARLAGDVLEKAR